MTDIKKIIKTLGTSNLAERLDCGETAISNAVTRGSFPAYWYLAVTDLAKESGIEVPFHLFNWKKGTIPNSPLEIDDSSDKEASQ